MKKLLFTAVFALIIFTSCKKTENETIENENATTEMQGTSSPDSSVVETVTIDSTNSKGKLNDKISVGVSTTKTIFDPAKGKFALSETKWKLVELNGTVISNTTGKDFYMNLDSKSAKFAANVGCNNIVGAYNMVAETKLLFSKIMSTKMNCSNADLESKFIKTLERVDNYSITDSGKTLNLFKENTKDIARFEAVK